jgi:hypothetical protein
MIRTGTHDQALANRSKYTLPNGTGYYKSEFIASAFEEALAPQSFLVEQDADSVILPHFHLQNEFQVVVQGEGSIGRHPVRPLAVHYAGAHTGYGPITAGPQGLWYFTLRPSMDKGARFLPEARAEMEKTAKKRHVLGGPVDVDPHPTQACCDEVFAPQADGIGAWLLQLPADATLAAPELSGGLGRFYVVAQGSASIAGRTLGHWATAFVTPDEEPMEVTAGKEGGAVLVLQFPQ